MTRRDSKFVSADRPVNRRTMAKSDLPPAPINPVVQERLAALKLRNRFGAPLSEQLRFTLAQQHRVRLHPMMVAGGMVSAISAIGLLLAAIQSSTGLASGAGLGVLIGFGLLRFARKPRMTVASGAALMPPLFDDAHLQAFDQALEQIAPEVPDTIAARLIELKLQVLRIAQLANGVGTDEHFSLDDRHYVTECLRRYLPDSLQSYMRVPPNARHTQVVVAEQTAGDLLLQQIGLMQTELGQREMLLNKSAAAQLMRQQRFLEAKTKEPF